MKQRELIELVKEHFTNASDTIIRLHLNNVYKDFCANTRILQEDIRGSTVIDQRYYDLDSRVIEVEKVTVENEVISKLVGRPATEDPV